VHALGWLPVVHGLRRHLIDEVVMLGIEPLDVALAEQRDRLPIRLAVGAAEVIAAVQPVLGMLHGGVPNPLLDLVGHDGVLAQVLDAVSQPVDVSAGRFQRPLERVRSCDDLAVFVRGEQADEAGDSFLQGFLIRAHCTLSGAGRTLASCFAAAHSRRVLAPQPCLNGQDHGRLGFQS
jgi:hypothetical protein